MRRLFLDMDGVITDFMGAAMKHYNIPQDTVFTKGVWDTTPKMAEIKGITVNQFWRGLTVDFWAKMPRTQFAGLMLQITKEYFGTNVCLLTSPADEISAHGKMLWIKEYLPEFYRDGRFCLNRNKRFLASKDALLIDDRDKNIDEFRGAGGKAILYPTPFNSQYPIGCYPEEAWKDFSLEFMKVSQVMHMVQA